MEKLKLKLAACLLFVTGLTSNSFAQTWQTVGTAGFSVGETEYISLEFSSSGEPYVAYRDDRIGNSEKATVMKFDGSNWINVGTAEFSAGNLEFISLAFSGSGEPYVAYRDVANSEKATVMKFDGSNWVNVGAAGFSAGSIEYTSLAFSGSGEPYVAYKDGANSNKATVMKFDGSNWVNVGAAGFSAGSAEYISLAFSSGEPYVAYRDDGNSGKATVMKFDGSNWVNVGTAGFSAGIVEFTSLAFSGSGEPYVAYRDSANSYKATVMKFDGSNWVNVGTAGFSAGDVEFTSLAFSNSGEPYVAYKDDANSNKATVKKFATNSSCTASFSYNNTGNFYTFQNSSTGSNLTYNWYFGDLGTSTAQSPTHTYANTGTYNVYLIVSNGSCSDTTFRTITVSSSSSCLAYFGHTNSQNVYTFTNYSQGSNLTYSWNFGDGSTSTQQAPVHTYSTSGTYNVCLVASNTTGCLDTFCKSITVTVPTSCQAYFNTSGTSQNVFTFNNYSQGSNLSIFWTFGDGDTSYQQTPTHTYFAAGAYTACLYISNTSGCLDTFCRTVNVTIPMSCYAIADFPFSGNANDVSGNGNNGVVTGAALTTDRFNNPNSAYYFDGVNDLISLPPGNFLNQQYTYSVWVNPASIPAVGTSPNGYSCVMHIGNTGGLDQMILLGNSPPPGHVGWGGGGWDVTQTGFSYYTGTLPNTNEWVHLALTRTVNELRFYVNGQLAGTQAANGNALGYSNNPLATIGSRFGTLQFFHGKIDDIKIFDCVLSAQDIDVLAGSSSCSASFSYTNQLNTYTFQNTSTGSNLSYSWNFGDGSTSTQQSPVHTYISSGTYNSCLIISNATGCRDTLCSSITVTSTASCTASFIDSSMGGNSVAFFNTSTNDSARYWYFGDNTSSTQNNPVHTYSQPGTYYVCLVILNQYGCRDTACASVSVGSSTSCQAYFNTTNSQNVYMFNNYSQGSNLFYNWYFGDGNADTVRSPTHVYSQGGTYNACLIVFNNSGCIDTFCRTITATGQPQCNASFTYTNQQNVYTFDANSFTGGFNHAYNFGDGTSAPGPHATHTFATGSYNVCLIVDTTYCSDTSCVTINVTGTSLCSASFSYTVSGSNVTFNNTSSNFTSSFWSFGDGSNSTLQNPTHTYAQNGTYQACLTIYDGSGCSDNICQYILISTTTHQYYCVSGRVTKGTATNPAYPATVYLIYSDTTLGTLTSIRTTITDQSGNYQFCTVPLGKYLVKAALNPTAQGYSNYVPTYFGNSLFWSYATEILVNRNFQQIDIWLIAGNNPGGPGFVGGYVSQGANKMAGPGDPIEGVQVMLLDEFDNPVQYIYSDSAGRWDFSNVAYGTYKVYAEVLGIPTYPYIVAIDAGNETVDNISLIVESTQVISNVTSIPAFDPLNSVNVYPNPTHDEMFIEMSVRDADDFNMIVTDVAGKTVVEEILHTVAGSQAFSINLSQQQAGIYLLNISGSSGMKVFKVVKY